jgi:hypothetical protein
MASTFFALKLHPWGLRVQTPLLHWSFEEQDEPVPVHTRLELHVPPMPESPPSAAKPEFPVEP